MIQINEFLNSFQHDSLLQGVERVTLLQKVVAGSIAYAAPCYVGMPGEMGTYYRNGVLTPAVQIITAINERFIINTDAVLEDVKAVWEGRYEALNLPKYSPKIDTFHKSLVLGNTDLSNKYDYWSSVLTPVLSTYYAGE